MVGAAKQRLLDQLQRYALLEPVLSALAKLNPESSIHDEKKTEQLDKEQPHSPEELLDSHLIAVAGDLSKPLLGMDNAQFKSLALEIDSIIHCGAQVNLIKPYQALKEANVLGTQEILRLATTNGFVKTKVKPVHYISTNGIFPVTADAYSKNADGFVICKEDTDLQDNTVCQNLTEGYAMTKWVAERMCAIAESRGLPISVLRPGNMAGASAVSSAQSATNIVPLQNPDDFNYLMIQGMIQLEAAPDLDMGDQYAIDLTPVDFAAKAVVHLAVHAPNRAIGQRLHLQNPQPPVLLRQVTSWLRELGYSLKPLSRDEWVVLLHHAAHEERQSGVRKSVLQKLESGFEAFEPYFQASTWLRYGCDNLQQALEGSHIICPSMSRELLQTWFPKIVADGTRD